MTEVLQQTIRRVYPQPAEDLNLNIDYWHQIKEQIISEAGEEAYQFISNHVNLGNRNIHIASTTTVFNINVNVQERSKALVNLMRVNDLRRINKFFEAINSKLDHLGVFIGCAETKNMRKQRILAKYPPLVSRVAYFFDYLIKRVFPKFLLTKKIYFLLTRGHNRVLTRAEILGRLYSCGFDVTDEKEIGGMLYFAAKKVKIPCYDLNPTYGPLIRLRRIGKNGQVIKVYKFRTMHPYAEYLQEYIYTKHKLQNGGKFSNDFRVSTAGKFMRAFWIDELPMFINVFKGEMKLVGVRPLSNQYYNLYPEELQKARTRVKPGLVPPYYADMPQTLEEIIESERRYLERFDKHPLRTQWNYFWKAMFNIFLRRARSC